MYKVTTIPATLQRHSSDSPTEKPWLVLKNDSSDKYDMCYTIYFGIMKNINYVSP